MEESSGYSMVTMVLEQINHSRLPAGTRSHALALLALCHHDNGHVAASWEAIAHAFGVRNAAVVRRHLGRMAAVDLIHYSSNGDGVVYVNFKAWQEPGRAPVLPNRRVGDTGSVDPTRARAPVTPNRRVGDTESVDPTRALDGVTAGARAHDTETVSPTRAQDGGIGAWARDEDTETVDPTRARAPVLPDRRVGDTGSVDPTRAPPPQLVGCLVDTPSTNGEINQTTNHAAQTPIDGAEESRTVALLLDVGVGIEKARALARTTPFEEARRQVAAWWPDFEAGRQQAGLLITRIEQRWGAPPPGQRWLWSELGRRHRTPAEVAAEEAAKAEEAAHRQRLAEAQPDEDVPSPYLDDDPGWRELVSELTVSDLAHLFAGVVEIAGVEGGLLYRIAVHDARKIPWIDNRLHNRLSRSLSRIVGQPVEVEFVPPLEVRP